MPPPPESPWLKQQWGLGVAKSPSNDNLTPEALLLSISSTVVCYLKSPVLSSSSGGSVAVASQASLWGNSINKFVHPRHLAQCLGCTNAQEMQEIVFNQQGNLLIPEKQTIGKSGVKWTWDLDDVRVQQQLLCLLPFASCFTPTSFPWVHDPKTWPHEPWVVLPFKIQGT